jgi:hypothetical protein
MTSGQPKSLWGCSFAVLEIPSAILIIVGNDLYLTLRSIFSLLLCLHFPGLRSDAAKVLSQPALKAFDDLLCNCLMVQTTPGEIQAFRASITIFDSKYGQKSFPQKAKNTLSQHGFSLQLVTALMETRSSMIQSSGATDTSGDALKQNCSMLGRQINVLSPRAPHTFGNQADCALLNWILKANHFPAGTHDVHGDGNCFLYATYGALLDAVGRKETANNKIFASAVRWLNIKRGERFCGAAVTEELASLQVAVSADNPDAYVHNNSFCDAMAFLPRMWGYLDRCLADPGLVDLRDWLDACVPAEARR